MVNELIFCCFFCILKCLNKKIVGMYVDELLWPNKITFSTPIQNKTNYNLYYTSTWSHLHSPGYCFQRVVWMCLFSSCLFFFKTRSLSYKVRYCSNISHKRCWMLNELVNGKKGNDQRLTKKVIQWRWFNVAILSVFCVKRDDILFLDRILKKFSRRVYL